jgi:hypothetical protein
MEHLNAKDLAKDIYDNSTAAFHDSTNKGALEALRKDALALDAEHKTNPKYENEVFSSLKGLRKNDATGETIRFELDWNALEGAVIDAQRSTPKNPNAGEIIVTSKGNTLVSPTRIWP